MRKTWLIIDLRKKTAQSFVACNRNIRSAVSQMSERENALDL